MNAPWILALSLTVVVQSGPGTRVAKGPKKGPANATAAPASPGPAAAAPASGPQGPFVPWKGKAGVTRTVEQIMEYERAHAYVWDGVVREGPEAEEPDRSHLPMNPASPMTSQWPSAPAAKNVQAVPGSGGTGGTASPQTEGVEFNGPRLAESGFIPPDSCGAIGPTQVLVCGNGRIKLYDRSGNIGAINASTDNFFSPVLGVSGTSDPQVKYDRISGRWFVTIIDVATTSNSVYLAVSSGPTITNASSFTFYAFQQDLVLPPGDAGQFADYPKVGIDANAIYIGVNIFGPGGLLFVGSTGFVVKKSSVLSGGPIEVTAFRSLGMNGGSDGPFAPTGADNPDPAATEGYFVGSSIFNFGLVVMRRVTDPGGTPSISGNLNITVPTTSTPGSQPALGSTGNLDALDDRLFAAQVHRNRITGSTSLWTAHNILVNSSGVASGGDRNGSRWYEIGSLTSSPALVQAGTLFDPAGTSPKGYWIPSCAMSGQGHMALASSYAGTANRAGIAAAGRFAGDSLGTIQAPTFTAVSTSSYNVQSGTQRWGDYSATFVDPTDDQTIWTFQEWCDANNSWSVRVTQLRAPPPVTPTGAVPSSVTVGDSNVDIVLTGASVAGSGFYDTEPGYNRLQATTSNPDITVNSVTFQSTTQVTMNVSISPTAATGPASVLITNPDGQTAESIVGLINVDPEGFTGFCFPDVGGVRTCPCGNPQVPALSGKGCDNFINTTTTSGTGGATLSVSGVAHASLASTLVFHVTGAHNPGSNTNLHVFWKGTGTISGGVKSGFGVRCVAGTLKRIYEGSGTGSGGLGSTNAVNFPNGTQTTDAWTASQSPSAGATLYYYDSFRDQQGPTNCNSADDRFNVSHAGAVTWVP